MMKVFSEIIDANKGMALALGFFDGVHVGHQKVIASAVDNARKNGTMSAVITFKEHPQVVLRGCAPEYILTSEQRRERFELLGVDYCYELDFADIAGLNGEQYLQNILLDKFSPISISTGFNHFFGVNRTGSPQLLRECANSYKYEYFEMPPVVVEKEVVSSSLIRKKLLEGDVCAAGKLLGVPFFVGGVVQRGAGLGAKIGFPTANISYPKQILRIPFGVYGAKVSLSGKEYSAIVNFGIKPTFEGLVAEPVVEGHILGVDKILYGEYVEFKLLKLIRKERKFLSVEELVSQIKVDIKSL